MRSARAMGAATRNPVPAPAPAVAQPRTARSRRSPRHRPRARRAFEAFSRPAPHVDLHHRSIIELHPCVARIPDASRLVRRNRPPFRPVSTARHTGAMDPTDVERLRSVMRASRGALLGRDPTATRAAWIKASADYYLAIHPDDSPSRPTGNERDIPSVAEIRDRAAVADRARIALPLILGGDPDDQDRWSAQVGWIETTLAAVFTEDFLAALTALRAHDPSGLEYCLRFLEADPWCWRANRTKAKLIYPITQLELDGALRDRLTQVVLRVVDDPRRRRKIQRYGRLAWAVGTAELRVQLEDRSAAVEHQVRFNARCVLEAWERLPPGK